MNFISTHPEGRTGELLCSLLTDGALAWVGASSSVVTLVAIALERYYAVIYPIGKKGKLTTRKLKVCNLIRLRKKVRKRKCTFSFVFQKGLHSRDKKNPGLSDSSSCENNYLV